MKKKKVLLTVTLLIAGIFILWIVVPSADEVADSDTNVADSLPSFTSNIFTFSCANDRSFTIQYTEKAERAVIVLADTSERYILNRAMAASGSRYESIKFNAEFWEHQDEATVALPNMATTSCIRTR